MRVKIEKDETYPDYLIEAASSEKAHDPWVTYEVPENMARRWKEALAAAEMVRVEIGKFIRTHNSEGQAAQS